MLFLPSVALPNLEHAPTILLQRGAVALIALHIGPPLFGPEILIRSRNRFSTLASVHVPETTMHKKNRARTCKHEIGFPRKPLAVKPVSESHPVQQPSHPQLRNGMGAANARHVVTALCWREYVCHARGTPDGTMSLSMFTFIDLFAGIGGMRLGFEAVGGRRVFTSGWDDYSRKSYRTTFPNDEHPLAGDITRVDVADIPDHDVLLAGFPCQPFSIAGVSKKNALGRPHGFECETQGTLFFDVARIIAAKRPKAFLLENVQNLQSHDQGNTFKVILRILRQELGYSVDFRVINAARFVPQHRERILIAGFREETGFTFNNLNLPDSGPVLKSILHPQDGTESPEERFTHGPKAEVYSKYVLTTKLWEYLQAYAAKHRAAGNGFGFGLVDGHDIARTLSARYYKDASEILVNRGRRKNPRRLTPRECARLM